MAGHVDALAARRTAWPSRRRWSVLPRFRAAQLVTGEEQGVASFGTIAAIGIHATLAVGGFVVLAAYIFG
jgi:hypothetical protein